MKTTICPAFLAIVQASVPNAVVTGGSHSSLAIEDGTDAIGFTVECRSTWRSSRLFDAQSPLFLAVEAALKKVLSPFHTTF